MSILESLTKRQRHAALFDAMAGRLGLRRAFAVRADRGAERRALERCMACSAVDACQTWLAETERAPSTPAYCNNHDMFERLKHDIEAEGFCRR